MTLTPATLTDWLRRSDSLRSGAVAGIRIEQEVQTSISTLTFLTATYTADVPDDMPRRLVAKSPLFPPTTRGTGSGEAHFYRAVAPLLNGPPLVGMLLTPRVGACTSECSAPHSRRGCASPTPAR